MKVCFPVAQNQGLDSAVYDHFGSAPVFMVVDAVSGEVVELINRDLHHAHGACQPIKALGGKQVDAVVVGGIGGGALRGLAQAGIQVYQAQRGTIAHNLEQLKAEALSPWRPGQTCGGHGHAHGHGQKHGHGHGCSH